MSIVTVSSKYQVVIPKAIRVAFDIQPGQKLAMIPYQGQIVLIPVKPMDEMRGFLEGIDTTVERDEDRV